MTDAVERLIARLILLSEEIHVCVVCGEDLLSEEIGDKFKEHRDAAECELVAVMSARVVAS